MDIRFNKYNTDFYMKEKLDEIVNKIINNRDKIIDDWCQAYLAEISAEGVEIKPGCFSLYEQDVNDKDFFGKKYWLKKNPFPFERITSLRTAHDALIRIRNEMACFSVINTPENDSDVIRSVVFINEAMENIENAVNILDKITSEK